MTNQALTVVENNRLLSIEEIFQVAEVFAKSGFFSDAKDAAKAVVKIMAGREIDVGPFASMTGIHVVQGKPIIGGNIIAAKVKGHPAYDYRILENTAERCEIVFYQNGQDIGHSIFTMEDAKAANLTKKPVWQQYPRNMLFNRAISNGARWYCPDVFSGVTVYTPEELDADNEHEIINVTPANAPTTARPEWVEPVVKAGEPDTAPAQATMELDAPTKPNELLKAANDATNGYYQATPHLLNAIRSHLGDDWNWPVNDPAAYAEALQVAIDHAEANRT